MSALTEIVVEAPRVSQHCDDCGGKDVSAKTFNLRWDERLQHWTAEGFEIEDLYCGDCGGEIGETAARPLEVQR